MTSPENWNQRLVEATNPAGKATSVSNLILNRKSIVLSNRLLHSIIAASAGRIAPVPASAIGKFVQGSNESGRPPRAPMVLQRLPNINARSGENVKFSVVFDGEPQQIEWTTSNGKPIVDGDRYKVCIDSALSLF